MTHDSKADRYHQDMVINSAISEANLEADMQLKCAGCSRSLSEREFEHYENHSNQDRLCKRCFMEGKAR